MSDEELVGFMAATTFLKDLYDLDQYARSATASWRKFRLVKDVGCGSFDRPPDGLGGRRNFFGCNGRNRRDRPLLRRCSPTNLLRVSEIYIETRVEKFVKAPRGNHGTDLSLFHS